MDTRRLIKRSLKWLVQWGSVAGGKGWLFDRKPHGFRILNYHRIEPVPGDSHSVKTAHFITHLKYLADHYDVIPLKQMVHLIRTGFEPPDTKIAITFDDGYAECASYVAENLQRYCIPATFFVITGTLDGDKHVLGKYMNWHQVNTLVSAGFEIGSHTVNHQSLGQISLNSAITELQQSKQRIIEETGVRSIGLAYPYGTLRDFSPEIASEAEEIGYEYALTAIHGLAHAGDHPYLLTRTTMTSGDGLYTFKLILRGALDAWKYVDKYGYRLQRVHTN